MATLEVADDGVGISTPAVADESGSGSGLGHKLVRSLSGQLRGKFYCESTPTGTRCRVVFPVEG